jgi:hypothetical protein
MARPIAGAAPCVPWSTVALLLALIPAAAAGLAETDGCALVQVDMKVSMQPEQLQMKVNVAGAPGGDPCKAVDPWIRRQCTTMELPADPQAQQGGAAEAEDEVTRLKRQLAATEAKAKGGAAAEAVNLKQEESHQQRILVDASRIQEMQKLARGAAKELTRMEMHMTKLGAKLPPIDFSALMSHPTIVNGLLMGDLTGALINLAKDAKPPTSLQSRTTDLLNGHSLIYNNVAVVVILACVCTMPFIGYQLDRRSKSGEEQTPKRFSYRVGLLLLASYLIWVPAIFSSDFSFNIGFIVPVSNQRVGITQDERHGHVAGPINESTRTLVHLLWSTRAHLGAILVAIYAFIVPAAKLILLGIGEKYRFSEKIHLRRLSRNCILLMQFISKWAAPDMFAYVLLYYLIRKLQHLPVSTLGMFDIGFTCYSVFTLTCAISSLGITLPQVPGSELEDVKPPLVKRVFGLSPRGVFVLASCLATAWMCFFAIGIVTPCFALHLDGELLQHHVPDNMKQVLKMIKLNQIIGRQDVSVLRSMWSMLYWFVTDRDLNLLLAFVMLAGFAVSLTALNMATLLKAAWQLSRGKPPCLAIANSHVFKHLCMLDVLVMGVFVGTLAAGIYSEVGVVISVRYGCLVLVMAELMHYLTHFVVHSAAEYEIKAAAVQLDGEKGKDIAK